MLSVGVAGLGRGMDLLNTFALRHDIKVVAVCDADGERAETAKHEKGLEAAYSDYHEFLNHDLDIVVVATPLPLHVPHSIAALDSGKHVLCEVPIANNLEEAEALAKATKRSRASFMFAENCCYWHFVRQWQAIVADARIGKPTYAEAEYVHNCDGLMRDAQGNRTWRARMPPIYYCTHSLGPILSIIKDRCVSAIGLSTGVNVAPDLGAIDMEFALFQTGNGTIIKVLCGFSAAREPMLHFFSLYGSKGCLETVRGSYATLGYFQNEGMSGMTKLPFGRDRPDAPAGVTAGGHGTAEHDMIDAFVASIIGKTKPPIDVFDGLDYSLPGLCAHLSAQQGGQSIDIPDLR